MRSLAPSMTLTCTFTVSPALKSGMSSRSDDWSRKSSVFIGDSSLAVHMVAANGGLAGGYAEACGPHRWVRAYLVRIAADGSTVSARRTDNWSIVPDEGACSEIAGQRPTGDSSNRRAARRMRRG